MPINTRSVTNVGGLSFDAMPSEQSSHDVQFTNLREPLGRAMAGEVSHALLDELNANFSSGTDNLYDPERKKWIGWPDTKRVGMETEVREYLNKVLTRARNYLYQHERRPEDRLDCILSANYKTRMIKLSEESDVVLILRNRADRKNRNPRCNVCSIGEVRSSACPYGFQLSRQRLAHHSRLVYGSHEGRGFTPSFSIDDDRMALLYYDRSGVLESQAFSIHEEPMKFLRIIVGFGLGEAYFLGFDPSFFSKDSKNYVKLNYKDYEILGIVHIQSVIRGRGTVVLHVTADGQRYALKDQRVELARQHKEDDRLRLREFHETENVAQLADHQLVRFEIGDEGIVNDKTGATRERIAGDMKGPTGIRVHRRILTKTFGESLKYFRSLKRLVPVFRDFAIGIQSMRRAKIYRRDTSQLNLLIVRKEGESFERGYAIDWDCAASVDHVRSGVAELTGAMPFMALSVLNKNGCPHKYYYDLESIFYALIWVCVNEDGPSLNGQRPKREFDFQMTPLATWIGPKINGARNKETVYKDIAGAKKAMMTDFQDFESRIIAYIPPYFESIYEMLREIRRLLFQPRQEGPVPEDRMPVSLRTDFENVFQTFIDILTRGLERLERLEEAGINPDGPVTANAHEPTSSMKRRRR